MKVGAMVLCVMVFLTAGCGTHPMEDEVKALLDETGAPYRLLQIHGGWVRRELHCELAVAPAHLAGFASKLGLDQPPYFEGEKRLVVLPPGERTCSASLRQRYGRSFGVQQWRPTRHGFASAIFFYDQQSGKGCLFLSIAYG